MNKVNKYNSHYKVALFQKFGLMLLLLVGCVTWTFAQDGDDYSDDYSDDYGDYSDDYSDDYGDYSSEDSSEDGYGDDYTEDGDDYGGDYDFGGSEKEEYVPKKIIRKPYVRFIPPYDSARELVLYKAVEDIKDREGYEVEIDTINFRAHKWLEAEYGKSLKKFLLSDGINEKAGEMEFKIKILGTFPCEIEPNEFTKIRDGNVEYELEIRVRDGRYRYTVMNLVHIADPIPGEKEGERTYFEYLMKSEDDVRAGDRVLIAADKKINTMMSDLLKVCQTAPIEEEDDW